MFSLEAVASLHLLKKDIAAIKRGSLSSRAKSKGEALKARSAEWEQDERNKKHKSLDMFVLFIKGNISHHHKAARRANRGGGDSLGVVCRVDCKFPAEDEVTRWQTSLTRLRRA